MKTLIKTLLIMAVAVAGSSTTHSCSILEASKLTCKKQVKANVKEQVQEENFGIWLLSSKFDY